MGKASFSGLDYSGERTRFAFQVADLTDANTDATLALVAAVEAALGDFSYIPFGVQVLALDQASVGQATNEDGQREFKARVTMRNTTSGKTFTFEIPAPIRAGNMTPGTDYFNLAATNVAALKNALEAVVKPPDNLANAAEVVSIESVGRSL